MFLFGKSKKHTKDALRSGTVDKVPSRMIAVPPNEEYPIDRDTVLSRLHDTDEITVLSKEPLRVKFHDCEYEANLADVGLSFPPDAPALGDLSETERQCVVSASHGVGVEMVFGDNNMDSFHLQIKLMQMVVPELAAVIDDNASRMFSGRKVSAMASSHVAPSPNNMFVVHVVNESKVSKSVWIHTHGLTRCGTIELEILGATLNNYDVFGNVLDNIAQRLIGDNCFIDEMEPKLVGAASDNRDIVITWERSEWALKDFPKNILGGINDRDDEHSINMGVIYLYENDDDVMHGKLTPILQWEEALSENAIFYKSTEETQRMRALALERVEDMRRLYNRLGDDKTLLIKVGLTPDPEYDFDDGQHEYIWFRADELREDGFTATLTQDAFYVKGMVEGVQRDYAYDDIVDWRLSTPEMLFTPDNIYLADEEPDNP